MNEPHFIIKTPEEYFTSQDSSHFGYCTYECSKCHHVECDDLYRGQMPSGFCECQPGYSPACPECFISWEEHGEKIVWEESPQFSAMLPGREGSFNVKVGKLQHLDIMYAMVSEEETPLFLKFNLPSKQEEWSHQKITPELEKEIGEQFLGKGDKLEDLKNQLKEIDGFVEVIGRCKICKNLWLCDIYTDS